MIPELLSFAECCEPLPCRGGISQIEFSLNVSGVEANAVPPGSAFYFGPTLPGCTPNVPFAATDNLTALALYHVVLSDPRNSEVSMPVPNQVDWTVTAESLMEPLGLEYDEAVALLTEYCYAGYVHCAVYGSAYEGPDPILFTTHCACREEALPDAPGCCADPCYQQFETGLSGGIPLLAISILQTMWDFAAVPNAFPAEADFLAFLSDNGFADYGQQCYDFSYSRVTAESGIVDRASLLWTPKRGNPCLHAFVAEADLVKCAAGGLYSITNGVVAHYALNGVSDVSVPFLADFDGDCSITVVPAGEWVPMAATVDGGTFVSVHPPDYVFPCDPSAIGIPATFKACPPVEGWCLGLLPKDRVSFVLEESVRHLRPGTYAVMLGFGANAGCRGEDYSRIGSVFVVPNPATGQTVGFLDVYWPNVIPGCYSMVISSEEAEDYPAQNIPAGDNLLTIGSGGTFDTSHWQDGISAPSGATLLHYGLIARSPFFSMRCYNNANLSSLIFQTDPIGGLSAGESYVFEIWVWALSWPTDPTKDLVVGVTANGTDNVVTNVLVSPNATSPTGQWIVIQNHIAAGSTPNGFQLRLEWSGPAFGAFPDYDVLFDDMSLRLAPYTLPPTPYSRGVNLCSECIRTLPDGCETGLVRYANNGNGMGYPYLLAPAGYRQQFRLNWMRKEVAFLSDRSLYSTSAGRTVPLHSRNRLEREFEMYFAPEKVHEILALAIEHDTFEVKMDGDKAFEAYVNEKDYKVTQIETFPFYNLRKSTLTLRLKEYQKVNAYC